MTEYATRINLAEHPAFRDLKTDTDGRPCVWRNHYERNGDEWSDDWSCQCEDDGVEPYASEWVGPLDWRLIDLWDSLPEE